VSPESISSSESTKSSASKGNNIVGSVSRVDLEQRVHEILRFEGQQVVHVFADTDPSYRELERIGNGENDASLGGAVELREDDPGNPRDRSESLRLLDAVGAGCGVEDQQHLVRCSGHLARRDLDDFFQLLHQVGAGVKTTCRVHQNLVDVFGSRRGDGVEDDCSRVRALLLMHDRCADPLRPDLELVDRRSSESICCGEDHSGAGLLSPLGELGGGGCLAGAVDPDQEGDAWCSRGFGCGLSLLGRPQEREQLLADCRSQLFGGGNAVRSDLLA
jgi:hypothetical protein